MNTETLQNLVKDIVEKATALKNKHIDDKNTPVNYACIFAQSKKEYAELFEVAQILQLPIFPNLRKNTYQSQVSKLRLRFLSVARGTLRFSP